MILYRHAPSGFPFLWEAADQPAGRWHDEGEGPVHYLAGTPDGAWAEFIRHEEITDPSELDGVRQALWAVEVPRAPLTRPRAPRSVLTGGPDSYRECRKTARRLRRAGADGLDAPSAALARGSARGWRVDRGLVSGPARDARVIVLFGRRPDLVGWAVVTEGRPPAWLLRQVRPLHPAP